MCCAPLRSAAGAALPLVARLGTPTQSSVAPSAAMMSATSSTRRPYSARHSGPSIGLPGMSRNCWVSLPPMNITTMSGSTVPTSSRSFAGQSKKSGRTSPDEFLPKAVSVVSGRRSSAVSTRSMNGSSPCAWLSPTSKMRADRLATEPAARHRGGRRPGCRRRTHCRSAGPRSSPPTSLPPPVTPVASSPAASPVVRPLAASTSTRTSPDDAPGPASRCVRRAFWRAPPSRPPPGRAWPERRRRIMYVRLLGCPRCRRSCATRTPARPRPLPAGTLCRARHGRSCRAPPRALQTRSGHRSGPGPVRHGNP